MLGYHDETAARHAADAGGLRGNGAKTAEITPTKKC
jgi:hypothetical protein